MSAITSWNALAAGVDIGGDQARKDAIRELTDPRYAADDPNLIQRGLQWLGDRITELLERAASVTPGGAVGVILISLTVIVLLVALWIGGRAALRERSSRSEVDPLFGRQRVLTAQQHRDLANAAQHDGDYSSAVREWFRASVRGLEERGLFDLRPGRTADEAAREIGVLFANTADQARSVAALFDAVTFGTSVATSDDATRARTLETDVRASTPVAMPA